MSVVTNRTDEHRLQRKLSKSDTFATSESLSESRLKPKMRRLYGYLVVVLLQVSIIAMASDPPLAPDVLTLLALKQTLSGPSLSTWSIATPLCTWKGVTWSDEGSFPINCEEETYTLTFTYATNLGAVATGLSLPFSSLSGTLSPAIANLHSLKSLTLNNNNITGAIPDALGNAPSLTTLGLHQNSLSGTIPPSLWNLCRNSKLVSLLLDHNNLSGAVPEPLGGPGTTCSGLTSLSLARNALSGTIPEFIANFGNLVVLDLSFNRFFYVIPRRFGELSNLRRFSVAGNELMGPIPEFQQRWEPEAFAGNSPWLCGKPLNVGCLGMVRKVKRKREEMNPTGVTLVITAVAVCIVLVFYGLWQLTTLKMYKLLLKKMRFFVPAAELGGKVEDEDAKFPKGRLVQFFFEGAGGGGVVLTEDSVLNSASELLEETSYCQQYRAWLTSSNNNSKKHMLSVSLFKDDITRDEPEFLRGVMRLAVVKHPCLVPLRAYYLSRRNEKLLIYDHVVGKSLADIIHGECTLNWPQRHKIALAIANGVAHLHLESLVHGNLKSSNILIDGDLNALLTSYGLHLVITPAATYSIVIDTDDKGYKAPELRKLKKLSTHIDVFSYGIVLLEILTGQKPGKVTGSNTIVVLQELVEAAILGERLYDVLDLELLKPMPTENGLLEALKLAMGCCAPTPSLRPTMAEVVHKLEDIQSKFFTSNTSLAITSP